MYATFDYYTTEWYGTIITESEDFDKYAKKASDYINYVTGYKAVNYVDTTDALKKACCAIADKIAVADEISLSVAGVASESVGSHSVSYRSSEEMRASLNSSMLSAANMYLWNTGLLYRGVPCIRHIP